MVRVLNSGTSSLLVIVYKNKSNEQEIILSVNASSLTHGDHLAVAAFLLQEQHNTLKSVNN